MNFTKICGSFRNFPISGFQNHLQISIRRNQLKKPVSLRWHCTVLMYNFGMITYSKWGAHFVHDQKCPTFDTIHWTKSWLVNLVMVWTCHTNSIAEWKKNQHVSTIFGNYSVIHNSIAPSKELCSKMALGDF